MSDKPLPDANCFLFAEKWFSDPVNHDVDYEYRWLPEIGNEDAILKPSQSERMGRSFRLVLRTLLGRRRSHGGVSMSRVPGVLDAAVVARIKSRAMANAASLVNELAEKGDGGAYGDTPIERILSIAVSSQIATAGYGLLNLRYVFAEKLDEAVLGEPEVPPFFCKSLFVVTQAHILDWPIDFVFAVKSKNDQVARLCVECDGHDFHERTKEQAAKDRSRDRRLQEAGFNIFRFTGSELFNTPCECADSVVNWALNEWFFGHQKHGRYY